MTPRAYLSARFGPLAIRAHEAGHVVVELATNADMTTGAALAINRNGRVIGHRRIRSTNA